jgi:hypothetical protein
LDGRGLEALVMPIDHGFSDHRIALTETILTWLGNVRPAS